MIKALSLILSFSLLFTSVAPSYAQALDAFAQERNAFIVSPSDFTAKQDATQLSNKDNILFEQHILQELQRQNMAKPGSAFARLQAYCAMLPTCTDEVSADAFVALLSTEKEYKADIAELAASLKINLKGIDLSAQYRALRAKELKTYENLFTDFETIYKSMPRTDRAVNMMLSQVMPAALALGVKSTQSEQVARRIYRDYFAFLNKQYPTVKSLKKEVEATAKKQQTQTKNPVEKYTASLHQGLGDLLPGALMGYSFVALPGQMKEVTEFVGKSAVTPLAAQTVLPFVSTLLVLKDYQTVENFLKAASVLEVKMSDKGTFWEVMNGVSSLFSPTAYIEAGSSSINTRYAGGNISAYGFYAQPGAQAPSNVWEDIPSLLVADGSPAALAVMNNVFYNGLTITNSTNLMPKANWNKGVLIPFVVGAIGTRKLERRALEGHGAFKKYFGSNLNLLGATELSLLTYKFYDLDDASYIRVRRILTAPYMAAINDTITPAAAATMLNFNVHSTNGRSRSGFNGAVYNPDTKSGLVLNESAAVRKANKAFYGQILTYASVVDGAIGVYFMWQMAKGVTSLLQWAKNFQSVVAGVRAGMPVGRASWLKATRTVMQRKPLLKEIARLEKLTAKAKQNPTELNQAKAQNAAARVESSLSRGILQENAATLAKQQSSFEVIQNKVNAKQPLTEAEAKVWKNMERYGAAEKALRSTQAAVADAKEAAKGPDYFEQMAQARRLNEKADVARMHRSHTADLKEFDTPQRAAAELASKNYLASEEGQAATQAARAKASKRDAFFAKYPLLRLLNKQATTLSLSILLNTTSPNVSNSAMAVSSLSKGFKPVLEMVDPRILTRVMEGKSIMFPNQTWKLGDVNTTVKTPASFVNAARAELGVGTVKSVAAVKAPVVNVAPSVVNFSNLKPMFVSGSWDKAAVAVLVADVMRHLAGGAGVLSSAGLGKWTEKINEEAFNKRIYTQIIETLGIADANAYTAFQKLPLIEATDASYKKILIEQVTAALQKADLTEDAKPLLISSLVNELKKEKDLAAPSRVARSMDLHEVSYQMPTRWSNFVNATLGKIPFIGQSAAVQKVAGSTVKTSLQYMQVSLGGKTFYLAKDYNFVNTEAQYANPQMALQQDNVIAKLIFKRQFPSRKALVWVLASGAGEPEKLQAYALMKKFGHNKATIDEVADLYNRLSEKNQNDLPALSEAESQELNTVNQLALVEQENMMRLVPQGTQLFNNGALDESEVLGLDMHKISSVLYNHANVSPLLNVDTKTTYWGNTKYTTLLPIYLRGMDTALSDKPLIYLTLNPGQSFTMPRGFVLALDEIGQWKLVPTNLRALNSGMPYSKPLWFFLPNSLKMKKYNPQRLNRVAPSVRHVVLETNFKTAEINYLASQLRKSDGNRVAIINSMPADQFETMMQAVAYVGGADLGASLSSQFKKTLGSDPWSVFFSGFGYLSPLIANAFKPLITVFGQYNTIKYSLMVMAGISALGMASGMTGFYSIDQLNFMTLLPMGLFFLSAITVASIFSMIAGPVLKTAYPDSTVFSSKNMAFTTTKGFSRLLVTAIPAIAMTVMPVGVGYYFVEQGWATQPKLNWSLLVPVVAALSVYGLWALQKSRLYVEHNASQEKEKAGEQAEKESTVQQIRKAWFHRDEQTEAMKNKFDNSFKPALKSVTSRLGKIYEAYAPINSVIIGVTAGMLYAPSTALAITGGGLAIAWAIRKLSDFLIKNKYITDDQLTGLSLPLMTAGIGLMAVMPFNNWMLLPWFLMYLATPTFGVSENTRMMNYVASYYKTARNNVRNNDDLKPEEKAAELQVLKKEEGEMKMRAASLYNSYNAKGFLTIMTVIAGLFIFKDLNLGLGDVAMRINDTLSLGDGMESLRWDMVQRLLGPGSHMSTSAAEATTGNNLLSLAIYRLSTLLPLAISVVLLAQNRRMIVDGADLLLHPIHLTQADIDGNVDMLGKLKFNVDNIRSNHEQLTKEAEELDTLAKGYADARNSEEKMTVLVKRMIWLNNRLKAMSDNTHDGPKILRDELERYRYTVHNLETMMRGNDVSDAFKAQAQKLIKSAEGIAFSNDEVINAYKKELQLIEQDSSQPNAYRDVVSKIRQFLDVKELSRLENALKTLSSFEHIAGAAEFQSRGMDIFKDIRAENSTVSAVKMSYLEEGIFKANRVRGYEAAKTDAKELDAIYSELTAGKYYDGMRSDFQTYYDKAKANLRRYVTENKDSYGFQLKEQRVRTLDESLDKKYQDFMQRIPNK